MIKQACIDLLREGYGKREIDEESLHVCRKRKATGKLLHLIQVMNEKLQFVWMQFAELYAYVRKQVDDSEKLNKKLAEMLALLTCEEQSNSRKSIKFDVTPKSKDILSGMNRRVKSIYSNLPLNAMLIICTGHGDTAFVQSDSGKGSSMVDNISTVRRCGAELSNTIPVLSDDEVLSKVIKEVRNEEVHLVWAQFAEHYAYVRNQADNSEKLNKKLAEIIALLTCEEQSNSRKSIKFNVTLKSKDILSRMNRRVEHLLQSSSKCHTNCLHWSWRHCTSSKLARYAFHVVADSKSFMSKFMSRVFDSVVKECRTVMLIKEIDFSRFMVLAQQIEDKKVKEKERESKRARTGYDESRVIKELGISMSCVRI
ncbi:putative ribosome maturation protein SBDS-like [Capsicum annuum]|nr:putative ribosome maturation protein SBDS-like [Capsicum annuum]